MHTVAFLCKLYVAFLLLQTSKNIQEWSNYTASFCLSFHTSAYLISYF